MTVRLAEIGVVKHGLIFKIEEGRMSAKRGLFCKSPVV